MINSGSAVRKSHMPLQFKCITFILIMSTFSWGGVESVSQSVGVNISQLIFRIIPVFIVVIYLFALDEKRGFKAIKLSITPFFLPVSLYIIFSVIGGSGSYYPLLSFWKAVEYFSVLYWAMTLTTLLRYYDIKEIYGVILISINLLLVWLVVVAFIFPSEGWFFQGTFKLNGIFPSVNPNALGFYALYGIAISYHVSKSTFIYTLIPLLFLLIIEASRSSYVSVLIISFSGLLVMLYKKTNVVIFLASIFVLIIVGFLVFIFWGGVQQHILRGSADWSGLSELSGRATLWAIGFEEMKNNLPFGNGIGTSTRFLYLSYDEIRKSVSMHNSPLELVLNAGLAGAVMILWFCYMGASIVLRFLKNRRAMIMDDVVFLLFVMLVVRSLSSSALASLQIELFLMYVIFLQQKMRLKVTSQIKAPAAIVQ